MANRTPSHVGRVPHVMTTWKRVIVAILLFGISFGYVEAAVVVYLHSLPSASPQREEPFEPIAWMAQFTSSGAGYEDLLRTELLREAATLIMLAGVALVAARNIRQWLAAFVIAFGAWDISYYAWLKALVDWPRSVFTWDVLFLLPVPWASQVLAPLVVSVSMIAAGMILFRRDEDCCALRPGWFHWALIFGGGAVVILSFTLDFHGLLAGRQPETFRWPLFALGEVAGFSGFLRAVWINGRTSQQVESGEYACETPPPSVA